MPKLSIELRWLEWARERIPASAPEIQRVESRRAFYAGAIAAFYGMMTALAPGDREPTEADMAVMDDLDNEFKRFLAEEALRAVRAKA